MYNPTNVQILKRASPATNLIKQSLKTYQTRKNNPERHKQTDLQIRLTNCIPPIHTQVIKALRAQGRRIPAEHTCFWTYQLLRGLKYMHSAAVLHRDLKPQNILLNSNSTCDLVVCDFGLSRVLDPAHPPRLSEFVVTRWYRAPEVTLTLNQYSSKMDLWSVGCILAEMLGGRPLFPGTNAIDQMQRILTVIGSPAEEDLAWIASESTREYMRSQPQRPPTDLAAIFPDADPLALGLLAALLHFNPDRRPSAAEALAHPYFVQRQYHNPEDEVGGWRG